MNEKIIMLVLLVVCSMLCIVGCGDKQLKFNGALNLTESKYYADKDNIYFQLNYNDDILRVGIITQIRKLVEEELKGKYKNINLIIRQEDPYDSVNYIFENNKWYKDVEQEKTSN